MVAPATKCASSNKIVGFPLNRKIGDIEGFNCCTYVVLLEFFFDSCFRCFLYYSRISIFGVCQHINGREDPHVWNYDNPTVKNGWIECP